MSSETQEATKKGAYPRAPNAGIEYMVLEGRLYGPYKNRLAHPIYNTDIEIEAIGPLWKETFRSKKSEDAAVILERA